MCAGHTQHGGVGSACAPEGRHEVRTIL
jgi:hypothetical protein